MKNLNACHNLEKVYFDMFHRLTGVIRKIDFNSTKSTLARQTGFMLII